METKACVYASAAFLVLILIRSQRPHLQTPQEDHHSTFLNLTTRIRFQHMKPWEGHSKHNSLSAEIPVPKTEGKHSSVFYLYAFLEISCQQTHVKLFPCVGPLLGILWRCTPSGDDKHSTVHIEDIGLNIHQFGWNCEQSCLFSLVL